MPSLLHCFVAFPSLSSFLTLLALQGINGFPFADTIGTLPITVFFKSSFPSTMCTGLSFLGVVFSGSAEEAQIREASVRSCSPIHVGSESLSLVNFCIVSTIYKPIGFSHG